MSPRTRLSVADLEQRVEELSRQLADAGDRQAAANQKVTQLERGLAEALERESEGLAREATTGEILRVISSSPTDLQPVLDAITESAARLCLSESALLRRVEGDVLRVASAYGTPIPGLEVGTAAPFDRRSGTGRAVFDRRTLHIHDAAAVSDDDLPETRAMQRVGGYRTFLTAPLLREGVALGAIVLLRMEARPFTDKQVDLLETFADQAVIAIENTRLFAELEERNQDLAEALEQQSAMADILRVIAASPTDLQSVLDAVARSAARLCEANDAFIFRVDGGLQRLAAIHGAAFRDALGLEVPISRGHVSGRAVIDRTPVHVPDLAAVAPEEFPISRDLSERYGWRSVVATPLLREDTAIGSLGLQRPEARPFTDKQIELLETFADQAVIAIENTRLFQELQERTGELARSVEELKALGEVGQAVSSTLDLSRVLDTIVTHADDLSGTDGAALYEYEDLDEAFHVRATRRLDAEHMAALRATRVRLGEGAVGRAAAAREPIQIPDVLIEGAYEERLREILGRAGHRAVLAVPLLREDRILGGLVVYRKAPGEFPPGVVELLQTFASQSALAIQNARLYREIEEKSLQLEVASKHKSEFLANMSHELRTPLNAIIGFSEVLVERMFGDVNEKQEEYLEDILSSGRHLLSLINDILDLSKVEAGRMELEVGTFSLREALENGLTMLKERAGRHGIGLGLEVDPDLDLVEADERKVKQVVFNLLSNAVKFTPDGGRVELSAHTVDGEVQIAVCDTGVGISPDDLEHVFDEFRQVGRGTAKAEGTGLGLALTKRFVELHGGRIGVESEVGVGSTFTLSLPLRRAPDVT